MKKMWKIEHGGVVRGITESLFFELGKDALAVERAMKKRGDAVYARFQVPYDAGMNWSRAPGIEGRVLPSDRQPRR
jgi:hypothetical protein